MAQGDVSLGAVVQWLSGHQATVQFTDGPRSGTTWVVRDAAAACPVPLGTSKFLGQGARLVAGQYWLAALFSCQVVESGRDQFGRLVGLLRANAGSATVGEACQAAGLGVPMTGSQVGDVLTITYSPDWELWGEALPIVVDTTAP